NPRPPSVRRISLYLSLPYLLFRLLSFQRFGLPYEVLLLPASSPPYIVSVRPFRYRSLAYFRSSVTADNLASYLASGHHPSASGTFSLWNTQIHRPYSPFKAHTNDMIAWPYLALCKVSVKHPAYLLPGNSCTFLLTSPLVGVFFLFVEVSI
ncbi:MAG: hypothetical protein AAF620_06915, partial [Bacteroidota bacterium]